MSSIEMNDALIRSSRFTDQLSEYEYIKVFARIIRPENEFTVTGESKKDAKLAESERDFFPSRVSNVKIDDNRRNSDVRSGSPRDIRSKKSSKSIVNQSSNQQIRFSPTSSNISVNNNASTPETKKRSNSCSPSRSLKNNTPHTADKLQKTLSILINNSSPKRPILSVSTERNKSPLKSPIKTRVEKSGVYNTISNECENYRLLRCVSIQDEKTIQLLPAIRCSCEACSNKTSNVTPNQNKSMQLELSPRGTQKLFNFDKVFRESSSQEDVYNEAVQNNVSTLFQGINSTVIANGAPGSGKTFTLQGTKAKPGVISRSLQDIFAYISKARADCDRKDFKVEISVVELQPSNQFRSILKEPNSTDSRSRTPSCHPDSGMETDFPSWAAAAKRVSASSGEEAMAIVDDATKALKKRAGKGDDVPSRSDQDTMLSPSYIFLLIDNVISVFIH